MDQGVIGTIFTLVVFISFVGIVWYTFSKRKKNDYDEAANLVFADEQPSEKQNKQETQA